MKLSVIWTVTAFSLQITKINHYIKSYGLSHFYKNSNKTIIKRVFESIQDSRKELSNPKVIKAR